MCVLLCFQSHFLCQLSVPRHVRLLRLTSLLCSLTLFVTTLATLIKNSDLRISLPVSDAMQAYMESVHDMASLTVLLGFLSSLLAIISFGRERYAKTKCAKRLWFVAVHMDCNLYVNKITFEWVIGYISNVHVRKKVKLLAAGLLGIFQKLMKCLRKVTQKWGTIVL